MGNNHQGLYLERKKVSDFKKNHEILREIFHEIKGDDEEYKNYYEFIKKLNYKNFFTINLKPSYKLAVGLGDESVYETSIMIHHTYGCPYIPASTIKGVYKSYLEENGEAISKELSLDRGKFLGFLDILFGNTDIKGILVFFDSFPVKKYKIIIDNISVHYKEYYKNGEKPPTDGQDKNIVSFPVITDTEFKFCIKYNQKEVESYRKAKKLDFEIDKFLEKFNSIFENEFKDALFYEGLGAKTSSGYGTMIEV